MIQTEIDIQKYQPKFRPNIPRKFRNYLINHYVAQNRVSNSFYFQINHKTNPNYKILFLNSESILEAFILGKKCLEMVHWQFKMVPEKNICKISISALNEKHLLLFQKVKLFQIDFFQKFRNFRMEVFMSFLK